MATGTRRVRHADPGAPRRGGWRRKAGWVASIALGVTGGAAIAAVLLYGLADWVILIVGAF